MMRLVRLFVTVAVATLVVAVPGTASAASNADLAVSMSVYQTPGATPADGRLLTFFVVVKNLGPDTAKAVMLTYDYGSDIGGPTISLTQGICSMSEWKCSLGMIPRGGSVTLTFADMRDYNGASNDLSVKVTSSTPDPVLNNNSADIWPYKMTSIPFLPSGGVQTGDGGTASAPSDAAIITLTLLAVAGVLEASRRWLRG
jgi:hypothetical protein